MLLRSSSRLNSRSSWRRLPPKSSRQLSQLSSSRLPPSSARPCPTLSLPPSRPKLSPKLSLTPSLSPRRPLSQIPSVWSGGRSRYRLPKLALFDAIRQHDPASTAFVHPQTGVRQPYGHLLDHVALVRDHLLQQSLSTGPDAPTTGLRGDLTGQRIAMLVENSYEYAVTLLAILAAKAIAVPLAPSFPPAELEYILEQSRACLLVSSAHFAGKVDLLRDTYPLKHLKAFARVPPPPFPFLANTNVDVASAAIVEPWVSDPEGLDAAGMMLYTSGTTSRPKGVLVPQRALHAQMESLVRAWKYSPADHLLHVLPLHHIHGTMNGLLAPLYAGTSIEFLAPFNADQVWKRFAAPFRTDKSQSKRLVNSEPTPPAPHRSPPPPVTIFTAVPAIYHQLLATVDDLCVSDGTKATALKAIQPDNMRLVMSGSAALPTPVKQAWQRLSQGNVLLERYGMTEVGMALSCGLNFADRVDGSVGWPLPGVEARLVDVDTQQVIPDPVTDHAGELQIRGPTVFSEYWANPKATVSEFVRDHTGSWFKTGDIAVRRPADSLSPSISSTSSASSSPLSSSGVEPGDHPVRPGNPVRPGHPGHPGPRPSWINGPMYCILGRASADIIKSNGEKISALEIEREILSFPEIAEAAVVGIPSETRGQNIAAILVLKRLDRQAAMLDKKTSTRATTERHSVSRSCIAKDRKTGRPTVTALSLRQALQPRLAKHKLPHKILVVERIPRNAMGKVNKKQLVQQLFPESQENVRPS